MKRKNPFTPEEKTAPSVRNPLLEQSVKGSGIVDVTDVTPAITQARAAFRMPRVPELDLPFAGDGPPTPKAKIASSAIPRVVADEDSIRDLPLGAREGFILAHVDGATSVRTLVDVSGMTATEVSRIVEKLVALHVVEVTCE